jgi:Acetyltransferase (GNAT) domain
MDVSVYTSFDELPKALVNANQFPSQPNFFLSNNWFIHLYEAALSRSFTPRFYAVTDNDGSISALLYCAVPPGTRKLVSLTNFYSLEFSVATFCAASSVESVVDNLTAFIAQERPRWNSVDFRYLKSGNVTNQALELSLQKHGFALNLFQQYENWCHLIDNEDYFSYFEHRPSQLKNTLRRKKKKLERDYNYQIKLYPRDEFAIAEVISSYDRVYSTSWKKEEPFPRFTPGLIQLSAQLGILILGILYIGGQPAAAQLWLRLPERFVIYKLAYNQQFDQLSVGTVLSDAIFEYAYSVNSQAEIDYGVGGESYKKQWMSTVRYIHGLEGFNKKSIGGLLLLLRYRAIEIFKGVRSALGI